MPVNGNVNTNVPKRVGFKGDEVIGPLVASIRTRPPTRSGQQTVFKVAREIKQTATRPRPTDQQLLTTFETLLYKALNDRQTDDEVTSTDISALAVATINNWIGQRVEFSPSDVDAIRSFLETYGNTKLQGTALLADRGRLDGSAARPLSTNRQLVNTFKSRLNTELRSGKINNAVADEAMNKLARDAVTDCILQGARISQDEFPTIIEFLKGYGSILMAYWTLESDIRGLKNTRLTESVSEVQQALDLLEEQKRKFKAMILGLEYQSIINAMDPNKLLKSLNSALTTTEGMNKKVKKTSRVLLSLLTKRLNVIYIARSDQNRGLTPADRLRRLPAVELLAEAENAINELGLANLIAPTYWLFGLEAPLEKRDEWPLVRKLEAEIIAMQASESF